MADYLRRVIESKAHPEQAYKSCRGILAFASRLGGDRLVRACRQAAAADLFNYNAIDQILRRRQDSAIIQELEGRDEPDRQMPSHDNIRGKDYFK